MRSRTFIIVAVAALIGVACGSDDDSGADATTAASSDAAASDTAGAGPVDSPVVDSRDETSGGGGFYSEPLDSGGSSDSASSDAEPADSGPIDAAGDDDGAAATPVDVAGTELGDVIVDSGGFVLYGFTPDEGGTPTCEDACADAWPPVIVESADLPAGLDAAVFSVAERADGSFQLAAGGWPLYRFAGDIAAGDTSGQGSGGVWFVVAADGTLVM